MDNVIKLCSGDGHIIDINADAAKMFPKITTMLNDNKSENCYANPVRFRDIPATMLRKIVRWAEHHVNDDPAEPKPKSCCDVPDFDKGLFGDTPSNKMSDLLLAANSLKCAKFLSVCCALMASKIKGKSTEEINELFNPSDDEEEFLEVFLRKMAHLNWH